MMHRAAYRVAIAAAVVFAAGAAGAQQAQPSAKARASMKDLQGQSVGEITLTQMPGGVLIRAELSGLPEGWHGFHIHENGVCEPPFSSAGGHFNPGESQHGFAGGDAHAGDLPNIHVGADGKAMVDMFDPRISLSAAQSGETDLLGRAASAVKSVTGQGAAELLDQNGAAIVVHAKADDYKSDPSGASGDRIACGVIERS